MSAPRVKLLIATANAGKVREFRQMLGDDRFEWSDLSDYPKISAVEETGKTFRENADLKAAYYATHLGVWALADDSGLEVDALNGSPGVLSARWAQINHAGNGDADNNSLLLQQLREVPDEKRTARFVCALSLSDARGQIVLRTQDAVQGRIIHQLRGSNGFGYDPLFLIEHLGKTTAELDSQAKHQISHRGKALRAMRELMQCLPSVGGES